MQVSVSVARRAESADALASNAVPAPLPPRPGSSILKGPQQPKRDAHVHLRPHSAAAFIPHGDASPGRRSPSHENRECDGNPSIAIFDPDETRAAACRPQSSPVNWGRAGSSEGGNERVHATIDDATGELLGGFRLSLKELLEGERGHSREESFVPRKEDDVESANEDTGHTWNEETNGINQVFTATANTRQYLKSEARTSTLRLHSLLSGASRLWQQSKGKPLAQPPPPKSERTKVKEIAKVPNAGLARQCGWRSGKVSRVLLAESPGFGCSATQHSETAARTAAHELASSLYNIPSAFSRRGQTPAAFGKSTLPQRAIAPQDMVHLCTITTQSRSDRLQMTKGAGIAASDGKKDLKSRDKSADTDEAKDKDSRQGRPNAKRRSQHRQKQYKHENTRGLSSMHRSGTEQQSDVYVWERMRPARTDSPFCIYNQETALRVKFADNDQGLTRKYHELAEKYEGLSEKSGVWASDPLSKIDRARRLRSGTRLLDALPMSNESLDERAGDETEERRGRDMGLKDRAGRRDKLESDIQSWRGRSSSPSTRMLGLSDYVADESFRHSAADDPLGLGVDLNSYVDQVHRDSVPELPRSRSRSPSVTSRGGQLGERAWRLGQ